VPGKNTVRVTIFNQPYTLLAAGDARETEELAQLVDDLMSRIAAKGGNVDSTRAAVLTCLHLADRTRTLERELEALRRRVDEKAQHLSSLLGQAVEEKPES